MRKDIEEITNLIRSNHFVNEDAIKQGIVLRILNSLGWNTFDTSIVWPEYSVEGQRVDYALCHPTAKPQIFIEVKQAATFGKGEEQLIMSYAFRHGVPVAILTDGQRWNFYLPIEQCPLSDRQFYVLDLKEREAEKADNDWWKEQERARGFASLKPLLGEAKQYQGVAEIEAAAPREVYFNTGAQLQSVWLNGERIYKSESWTGWHPGKDCIAAKLQAGRNTIVIESGETFFLGVTGAKP